MRTRKTFGFTLIELLVVISIIALLIAMLIPISLTTSHDHHLLIMCMTNLKSQGTATFEYAMDNNGWSPNCWLAQFGNGDLWGRSNVWPKWSRDSKERPGQSTGTYPDGLLWQYLETEDVWLCPKTPHIKVMSPGTTLFAWWGFPYVPWSYSSNGQPAYSMGNADPGDDWNVKVEKVKPSPGSVLWHYDQWPYDNAAYDNTVTLYGPTYTYGADSLTDYHNGGGTILFFDWHVEWMHRETYLDKVSTPQGTTLLCGGYTAQKTQKAILSIPGQTLQ